MTFVKVMYTAKAHTTVIGTVAPLNWRAGDDRGFRLLVTTEETLTERKKRLH